MRDRIIAAVAFGVRRIAKKDAGHRPRCELMRSSGSNVGIARATEYAELSIGGWHAKQEMMRCEIPASATGTNVNE